MSTASAPDRRLIFENFANGLDIAALKDIIRRPAADDSEFLEFG